MQAALVAHASGLLKARRVISAPGRAVGGADFSFLIRKLKLISPIFLALRSIRFALGPKTLTPPKIFGHPQIHHIRISILKRRDFLFRRRDLSWLVNLPPNVPPQR